MANVTPRARAPLTRERILKAAVRLVDEQGLEALSMRRLGAELGVEAMSIYNHVADKDALVDGVLDTVLREVRLPSRNLAWEVQVRRIAHGVRNTARRHPNLAPLYGTRGLTSLEGFRPIERWYQLLREAGLEPQAALGGVLALTEFLVGNITTELAAMQVTQHRDTLRRIELVPPDHPYLAELGRAFLAREPEEDFEAGLDLLLDGLHILVEEAGAPT